MDFWALGLFLAHTCACLVAENCACKMKMGMKRMPEVSDSTDMSGSSPHESPDPSSTSPLLPREPQETILTSKSTTPPVKPLIVEGNRLSHILVLCLMLSLERCLMFFSLCCLVYKLFSLLRTQGPGWLRILIDILIFISSLSFFQNICKEYIQYSNKHTVFCIPTFLAAGPSYC